MKKGKNKKIKIVKAILIIALISILILGIWLGISTHIWKSLAKDMLVNENSIVQDTEGRTIATLGEEKNKKAIPLNQMPQNLKNAYVAIEDERFYSHNGVDIKRTGAAILSYVFHFGSSSYGGSTITQQLVKNLTGDATDSITRKVKEWWKAWQLETTLSKEEILEAYLNIIYVGPNVYGVEMGANYYFNKSASELTLEECAFLAGINNSPNSYNPFTNTDNSEKIQKRTKIVLEKMKDLKYIKEEEYQKAIQEVEKGLNFKKGTIKTENAIYSYHTDALILEVINDISKKYNISKTFSENYINMAGLTIYSNQNTEIQKQTESECKKRKYSLASKNGGNSSQAAMVIIDHKTGSVVATTGGLGEKTESRCFNRATQSVRQTGSAIKPIAVLVPAIDKKKITSSEIVNDTERDFEKGYHPVDYSKPLGNITVRRAVESSQNVPFVEIMEKIKPSTSIKYLKKMGISTLTEKDEGLPLSLGGLDKGISPLEMAGAYSTIANDGIYIEPTFYSKIDKKNNETIVKPKQKKRRVFSKEVAYILKEILTQPVQGANGTATYCKISGVDVAAKTGTTDENYDRWLCGFTPYYTAVTWYGYDINESVDFNRKNPAGLIWANVMSRIHTGLKNATFEKPNGIIEATICTESGKKAKTGCTHTYTEYFLWGTVPGLCNKHSGNEFNETKRNENTNTNGTVQGITNDIDAEEPQRTSPIIVQEDNQEKPINQTNNNSTNTTNEATSNNTTNSNETNTTNTSNSIKNELINNTNTNVTNTTNSATNQTNTANNNLTLDQTNTTSTNNDV